MDWGTFYTAFAAYFGARFIWLKTGWQLSETGGKVASWEQEVNVLTHLFNSWPALVTPSPSQPASRKANQLRLQLVLCPSAFSLSLNQSSSPKTFYIFIFISFYLFVFSYFYFYFSFSFLVFTFRYAARCLGLLHASRWRWHAVHKSMATIFTCRGRHSSSMDCPRPAIFIAHCGFRSPDVCLCSCVCVRESLLAAFKLKMWH